MGYKRLDSSRPAVIISHNRSGGTYLCHSLNSHPLIHCFPDEVLHNKNTFRKVIHDPVDVLRIVLHLNQFEVSMCKISYTQFLVYPAVRDYIRRVDAKVIHLTRGNWVASAISEMVRHNANHPTHSFYERPTAGAVTLSYDKLWQIIWAQKGNARKVRRALIEMGMTVSDLTYPQIVGGEGNEAVGIPAGVDDMICNYLGVPLEPLNCGYMRKVTNHYAMVANWEEIKEKLKGTKFEGAVEEIENVYRSP